MSKQANGDGGGDEDDEDKDGDAPSLIKAYCNNNIFGHPGIDGPPDGFPASAGRVGRGAGFSILGQRLSGMLRPC